MLFRSNIVVYMCVLCGEIGAGREGGGAGRPVRCGRRLRNQAIRGLTGGGTNGITSGLTRGRRQAIEKIELCLRCAKSHTSGLAPRADPCEASIVAVETCLASHEALARAAVGLR